MKILQLGETENPSGQHVTEQGGNIYAIAYGRPSIYLVRMFKELDEGIKMVLWE